MTIPECIDAVLRIFSELFPDCTVAYSYPGMSERPPLPYILLDFGKPEKQQVDSSFNQGDGVLYQCWHVSLPLTVDMVIDSKTRHKDGKMSVDIPSAFIDLQQASMYFDSPMAHDKLYELNLAISEEAGPQPVYGSAPGIGRARASYSVDFTTTSKEYAALHPVDGEYEAARASSASKELADKEAGWFNEVELKPYSYTEEP